MKSWRTFESCENVCKSMKCFLSLSLSQSQTQSYILTHTLSYIVIQSHTQPSIVIHSQQSYIAIHSQTQSLVKFGSFHFTTERNKSAIGNTLFACLLIPQPPQEELYFMVGKYSLSFLWPEYLPRVVMSFVGGVKQQPSSTRGLCLLPAIMHQLQCRQG